MVSLRSQRGNESRWVSLCEFVSFKAQSYKMVADQNECNVPWLRAALTGLCHRAALWRRAWHPRELSSSSSFLLPSPELTFQFDLFDSLTLFLLDLLLWYIQLGSQEKSFVVSLSSFCHRVSIVAQHPSELSSSSVSPSAPQIVFNR